MLVFNMVWCSDKNKKQKTKQKKFLYVCSMVIQPIELLTQNKNLLFNFLYFTLYFTNSN